MKYAKVGAVVRWSGGTTVLNLAMSADDDHPLVVERPDLFTDEAPGAELKHPYRAAPVEDAPVERATRAPGEKRITRRSQKTEEQGDESTDSE